LKTFFILIFVSFWSGVAVSYISFYRHPNFNLWIDFLKGLFTALAALYLIGTPIALVVAGSGLLSATNWFPYPRGCQRELYGMAAGLLLIMVPDLFLLLLLWCFFLGILQHSFTKQLIASYFFILPLLMFFTNKSDVYILFSILLFVIALLDNAERLEAGICLTLNTIDEKVNYFFKGRAGFGVQEGASLGRVPGGQRIPGGSKRQETWAARGVLSPKLSRLIRRTAYVLAIFLLVFIFFLNRYVYRGFGMQVELFRKGPPEAKVVALTFDDGPDPRFTPAILKILEEQEVKATFFMVGKHAEKYPNLAFEVAAAGHEIGNHTYSHVNMLQAPLNRMITEIGNGEEAILNATGQRPYLFRPPRGLYDTKLIEETKERGYTVVLWSLSSNDWLEMRPSDITRTILKKVTPGDIVLFHDSGNLIRAEGGDRLPTVRSLENIIVELKKRGYDFVTVTELLILSGLSGDL
jgi:peptidoglycan/xylan/chitin deacetylase (PgdA/CDA1 family)